jgi:hypothetical protein
MSLPPKRGIDMTKTLRENPTVAINCPSHGRAISWSVAVSATLEKQQQLIYSNTYKAYNMPVSC